MRRPRDDWEAAARQILSAGSAAEEQNQAANLAAAARQNAGWEAGALRNPRAS